jgi:predicted nuclease of predicted toxin-antitoxin system
VASRLAPLTYLLDEDIHPEVAAVARGLGLEALSVHEVGRRGRSDFDQLRLAAADRRIFVTRNRDDFITLTVESFRAGEPHHGLLILPYTLSNADPARAAHALVDWHRRWEAAGHPGPYFIEFVTGGGT